MLDQSMLFELLSSPVTIALLIPGITLFFTLYQLFLHPLSSFPGPFLARISSIPITLACRNASKSAWIIKQHSIYGPVVRISPNHVSISSPEAISQIYSHKTGFLKGRFYQDKTPSLTLLSRINLGWEANRDSIAPFHQVEPVLFNTTDLRIHQRKRKYISPAFSAKNLKEFEPYMNPSIEILVEKFRSVAEKRGILDFGTWSNFLAFDVIGNYAFGTPFGFLSSGKDSLNLIHIIDTRGEVLNALGHLPIFLRPYMKYFIFDSFWYKGLNATSTLATLGKTSEARRRSEKTERKDLMSFLLSAEDPETGGGLEQNEVIAEAISFIVGGSDTTSSTMTNFMDFVSRDGVLQEKIFRELEETYPGNVGSSWVADEEKAGKLLLLNATLKEVMRLRPTSSTGLERVIPNHGRVVAGVHLPAGALVSVPTVMIHHNEDIYHEPLVFKPERWLESNANELTEYFIPFSTGPRACIGRNFAWMEMLKTLATLFRIFEFRRVTLGESETREGFFVKIWECEVEIMCR